MPKKFSIAAFKWWLTERGAILKAPTNEWEVLRVSTCDGQFVVYTNKAGKETWPDGLLAIRDAYEAGRDLPLSPDQKSRKSLRHLINDLAGRDGLWCWFCEVGFLTPDSAEITIEHLVPLCHGGPNHLSNIVIACQPCNQEAGNLSVAEKARLRDAKRKIAA